MVDPTSRIPLVLACLLALTTLGLGPCGPIPGGALSGRAVEAGVDDWSFVNAVPNCAVEVRPGDPHSVTVNCMAHAGRLFVSCSACEGKTWSGIALEDSRGRIGIEGQVYPVDLTRVESPALLDAVWRARAEKLGDDPSPRPDGWWTFELRSR